MSEPILLAGRDVNVDRKKIGVSYSGGGAMVPQDRRLVARAWVLTSVRGSQRRVILRA